MARDPLRIGITADWQEVGGSEKLLLGRDYFEWLRAAGLAPVALPALPGSEAESLRGLDALVLSGGGDIRPYLYGGDPTPLPTEKYSHPDRSAFEFALVWRSVRLGLPLLGICLGCQTINAAMGGDLIRDLEELTVHHQKAGPNAPPKRHRLVAEPGTVVADLLPSFDTMVHSSHHQAVGRLAPGFEPAAWGPGGVIEAILSPSYPRLLGVQWHPERTQRSPFAQRLALWLKEQAEEYKRSAAPR